MNAFRTLGAGIVAAVVCGLCATPLAAKDVDRNKPWAFLSMSPDLKADAEPAALAPNLRPNAAQELYLYVRNPPAQDKRPVRVDVLVNGASVATSDRISPDKGQTVRVTLPKAPPAPAPAADAAKKPVTPAPGTPLIRRDGKYDLTLRLIDDDDEKKASLNDSEIRFDVQNPANFLTVGGKYDSAANRLTVELEAGEFAGPPCQVQLVLSPDSIPGLLNTPKEGRYRGTIASKGKLVLFTSDLQFADGSNRKGEISLTVDDCERAILRDADFSPTAGGTPTTLQKLETKTRVRVAAPKAALPGKDCPVRLEVDFPPDTADKVSLKFEHIGGERAEEIRFYTLSGDRELGVTVRPGEAGGLLFNTVSRDHTLAVDTKDVFGKCRLEAAVLDAAGKQIAGPASEYVWLDASPPGDVRVVNLPDKLVRGKPLPITLLAADRESGVSKVEFFVGAEPPEPTPDGKPAAGGPTPVVAALTKTDENSVSATAEVPVADKKGPVMIYARVTNGVGLNVVDKKEIELIDPPPSRATIKGQVFIGTTKQPNLTVALANADGKDQATAKTDKDGKFEFKDVAPGAYKVKSAKGGESKVKGEAPVTVVAGEKEVQVKLELKR